MYEYGLGFIQATDQLFGNRGSFESFVSSNCARDPVQSLGPSVLRCDINSIGCLSGVFTFFGIDFFHEYEVEVPVEPVETESEPVVPEVKLEEEIAPPEFTLLSSEPMEDDDIQEDVGT